MLKSHEKFHSANGKRLILVADDEMINRELLRAVLESDYEILFAEDGRRTLDLVRENKDDVSLVLLDLMMPLLPGQEVLRRMKADPDLRHIPVIVLTADQNAEIECLTIGANDYIPKPYPQAGIILARVRRAIELSEDREIIQSTERDPLTGLYNIEFFYSYAEQYDQHHKDLAMDAVVVDINHFHVINERFGTVYGDEILRSIGEKIRESVAGSDGIVCRRSADTFMAYFPHGVDYKQLLENASVGLGEQDTVNSHVRLRMGVYANVDKSLPIERRFDRAKLAADTIRNSYNKTYALYDNSLHEQELYAERLVEDFQTAIEEEQFVVHFQPKFNVTPQTPYLSSAEALVRWQHPELGMISPGVFIPLFETNGLILELDSYVWRHTAAHLHRWKQTYGFVVPVSVNVSRVDMYDPDLLDKFARLLEENDLAPSDMLLEITESAYTEDSEQIIATVNRLREMGFRIEMDDFGTGYSSLNMISELPIDALKLDMQFVRTAFKDRKDTRMLEVIIDIADHLEVPVIAEGVETEEQMVALKDLGCDIVQGYYFSRPVAAEQFAPFLEKRMLLSPEDMQPEMPADPEFEPESNFDLPPLHEPAPKKRRGVKLRVVTVVFLILAVVIALLLVATDVMISRVHRQEETANDSYVSARIAAADLKEASDYLTTCVRSFVVTGDRQYLDDYFTEVYTTRRRDNALSDIDRLFEGVQTDAYSSLETALRYSNELMLREYAAMRLAARYYGISDLPDEVLTAGLSDHELLLSGDDQITRARELVFDEEYQSYKELIYENVSACTEILFGSAASSADEANVLLERLILTQAVILALFLLAVGGLVWFIVALVINPLLQLVDHIKQQRAASPAGASELRFLIQAYNEMLSENLRAQKRLNYEVMHDPLTGLYNRNAYEMIMDNADSEHIALLIIDVDNFKHINDHYGHEVGDRVLKRVGEVLEQSFRSIDAVCRLGGDEFVVVMMRANSSMRQMVINKVLRVNEALQSPKDGLPRVSLSAGVAFSDRQNPRSTIFNDADEALYKVKQNGRCGCGVYDGLS